MLEQVENKIKELSEQQKEEYYRKKDADLLEWGLTSKVSGKKVVPLIITDEEYEALIDAYSATGRTSRNIVSNMLNITSIAVAVLGLVVGIVLCVFNDDIINQIIEKAEHSDGFVFGSPVYFAHPSGRLLSVLNRLFYAGGKVFAFNPGAAVVSARRAGTSAALDVINKYFNFARMPVVSSTYWNMVHGNTPEEVIQDKEGLQIMRNLGKNMAWLLNVIECSRREGLPFPKNEFEAKTNFVR